MKCFQHYQITGLLVIFVGCENEFNPIASFQPKLVVYSVLSAATDTQFIRIYTSFDPHMSSSGSFVSDATVQLTEGSTVYSFRDTTVRSTDSSVVPDSVRLYYNPSMGLKRINCIPWPCPLLPMAR